MPLTTGARIGPYEMISPAGAGGMGEVEAFSGREAKRSDAGSPLPKS